MPAVQAPAFSASRFRAEREADWIIFDQLLTRLEKGSASSLSTDELLRLPVLYRATLSSLSIARATSLDRALNDHLESLAMRGYFLLYGVREKRSARLLRFFARDWPAAVRAVWKETLVIALVLLLGIATSWSLTASDPQWFFQFVPENLAGGRTPEASTEYLRSTIGHGKALVEDGESSGMAVFASYLFQHNSRIGIMSFALGFAFGVPTLLLIFYNGLSLGPMLAVFAGKGLGVDFGGWLAIHGTTELFAIILAGAAGLKIGTTMLFPGEMDRLTALSRAGRTAGKVMVGVIIMMLCAGLLEGFGRQLITDTVLRYSVGGTLLLGWLAFYYAPRRTAA